MGAGRRRPDLSREHISTGADAMALDVSPALAKPTAISLGRPQSFNAVIAAHVLDGGLLVARHHHSQTNKVNGSIALSPTPRFGQINAHRHHVGAAALGQSLMARRPPPRASLPPVHRLGTAGWELKAQRPSKVSGPVAIVIPAARSASTCVRRSRGRTTRGAHGVRF